MTVPALAADRDEWTATHCALCRLLFAACGRAGVADPQPRRQVLLTSLAGRFAFHAELLYDLLPVRDGVDRDALVVGATSVLAPVADAIERAMAAGALVEVLADAVVPHLRDEVRHVLQSTDGRLDAHRTRSLGLVARDLDEATSVLRDATGEGESSSGCVRDARGALRAVGRIPAGRGG